MTRPVLAFSLVFLLVTAPMPAATARYADYNGLHAEVVTLNQQIAALNDSLASLRLAMAAYAAHGLPLADAVALVDAADKYGLPVDLVLRVIEVESGFRPDAVSSAGAVGMMQVMPATAKGMGYDPRRLTEPAYNVEAGCRYLAEMVARFGVEGGLTAYNQGPRGVSRDSRSAYSERVMTERVGK